MRLRIIDIGISKWFWLVVFFQRTYGEPWIELLIFRGPNWKSWFHFWKWETRPVKMGQMEVDPNPVKEEDLWPSTTRT